MGDGNDRGRREAFSAWVQANGLTVADVARRRRRVPQTTLYSYVAGKSQSLKGITPGENRFSLSRYG